MPRGVGSKRPALADFDLGDHNVDPRIIVENLNDLIRLADGFKRQVNDNGTGVTRDDIQKMTRAHPAVARQANVMRLPIDAQPK